MTEAILSSIVHGFHIVVAVSSGDGLRTFTNAAVPPSGGTVATQTARPGSPITDINDIGFSDAVSRDYDSGSIDVGGSTLDDIFSAPPQDPKNRALKNQHAFPATRYNGARNYSSGFGSRVNVSAPGDNVLSFSHTQGGDAQAVSVVVEGGTSASTPEVAAAAAVVQQVARLTGTKKLATNPLAMRDFLAQTGTPLPAAEAGRPGRSTSAPRSTSVTPSTPCSRAPAPADPAAHRGWRSSSASRRSALGGSITHRDRPGQHLAGRPARLRLDHDLARLGRAARLRGDLPAGRDDRAEAAAGHHAVGAACSLARSWLRPVSTWTPTRRRRCRSSTPRRPGGRSWSRSASR